MKLTILGSGAAVSGPNRVSSGFLIENGNEKILIDLGYGVFFNLKKIIAPTEIHNILLTHYHMDHYLDLFPLINYKEKLGEKNQLNIFAPKGFKEIYEKMCELNPKFKELSFKISIKEIEFAKFNVQSFEVQSKKVKHKDMNSVMFKVKLKNKSIVFSGDIDEIEPIIDFAKNVDLLTIDSTSIEMHKSHISVKDGIKLAVKSNPKKVLLVHMKEIMDEFDVVSEYKKQFQGEVIKAEDLMQLEV